MLLQVSATARVSIQFKYVGVNGSWAEINNGPDLEWQFNANEAGNSDMSSGVTTLDFIVRPGDTFSLSEFGGGVNPDGEYSSGFFNLDWIQVSPLGSKRMFRYDVCYPIRNKAFYWIFWGHIPQGSRPVPHTSHTLNSKFWELGQIFRALHDFPRVAFLKVFLGLLGYRHLARSQ